jgi:general secretion pathway protein B
MSFILDALKKSENDRQRQSGPALFEVRVAPPRSKFPSWAIALVALLVVNLGVVGWLMFRKPAAAVAATPAVSPVTGIPVTPPATTPAPAGPPAQLATAPVTAPPQTAPAPPASAYSQPTAPQQQQQQYEQNPTLQDSRQAYNGPPPDSQQQPQRAYVPDNRYTNNAPPPEAEGNPDDYAPATEPTGEAPLGHVRRGLPSGLMTYEEAATKNQIPPLRLDLHVYAPDPRRRFVLVNMKKLTEGESLPEGVKVESITTDGAILSYRGVQFMMERD